MMYRSWNGVCLCGEAGMFPQDALPVSHPFSPLVILVKRDPLTTRGLYAVSRPEEADEEEGPACLLPCRKEGTAMPEEICRIIHASGAMVLNTAFQRAFSVLDAFLKRKKQGWKVTLVGLGDVGGTILTGLKLLGREIHEIAVYDPYTPLCERYEMELNQVLPQREEEPMPRITICPEDELFHCDVLIFSATRGVPPLGSREKDVRMAQFDANREMLEKYAQMARAENFCGLFCQVSDPVDHLARSVFLASQKNEDGVYDFAGLLPEQVQGFGLGVMAARARYWAERDGIDFSAGRVYGPHGEGLVVANSSGAAYDEAVSLMLTNRTKEANLRVRELGFKPYIAPGLSSAAVSILRLLRGEMHYGAVPLGGTYFGCLNRWTENGLQVMREEICPPLLHRIEAAYTTLKEFGQE